MIDIETIGVAVDSSGVIKGRGALDDFGKSADSASRKADNLGTAFDRSGQKITDSSIRQAKAHEDNARAVRESNKQTNSLLGSVGKLAAAYATFAAAAKLSQIADDYTKLNAQLKNATEGHRAYAEAYANVERIGKSAQADIGAIASTYARLSNALKDVGASQLQVSNLTETLALALKVNGASAAEAASTMLQLSQSFGKGKLDGDEFRTAMEAAPNVMRRLAESMKVPFGALKDLAAQGVITNEVMLKAFGDPDYLASLRTQADGMRTTGGGITELTNQFTFLVGELDLATGASKSLSKNFAEMAGVLETFRKKGILEGLGESAMWMAENLNLAYVIAMKIKNLDFSHPEGPSQSGKITTQAMLQEAERLKLQGQLNTFLNNKDFDTKSDKTKKDLSELAAAFATATKGIDTSSNEYQIALARFNDKKGEIVAGTKGFKDASSAAKKLYDEQVKYAQSLVDWDTDQQETRDKLTQKSIEKAQKEAEKSAKLERDNAIDYFQLRGKLNDESIAKQRKAIKDHAEDVKREYEKVSDNITRSITDGLMRGFEKGKSFAENFKDTLLNMFKTMILQPVVKMVVDASGIAKIGSVLTGGASGTAMAGEGVSMGGGGGFGGMLSAGKSLLQGITSGFDTLNIGFEQSIQSMGSFLVDQGFDTLGGMISQYSSAISNVLPFAGAAFSLLTGDIKGAVAQGIGAGVGMWIGGPVGGLIGGALGSVVGGLFGGSGEKYKQVIQQRSGSYVGGEFSATQGQQKRSNAGMATGLDQLNETFSKNLSMLLKEFGGSGNVSTSAYTRLRRTSGRLVGRFGASFDGGSVALGGGREWQFGGKGDIAAGFQQFAAKVLGEGLAKAIRSSSLPDGIRALFNTVSSQASVAKMINATISLNRAQTGLSERFGLTTNEAAKVASQLGYTGDALSDFITQFATLGRSVMSVGQNILQTQAELEAQMGDLPDSLKAFDAALKAIDTTTQAGIETFTDLFALREQFAAFQGSIDALKGNVRGAIFNMSSAGEQQAMLQEDLAKMFGELNMSVPGSVQELIALGKSIDFTTEEGLNLAAVFPSLVQAFNATQSAADDLMNSLKLGPDRFRSLFEYSRAQAYAGNGISLDRLPSYDVGTSYVPKTGPALIHQGERILTAAENRNHGNSDAAGETRLLRQETQNMRRELRAIAISASDSARALERLQKDGFVIRDVDQNGDPQVVKVEVVA